MNLEDRIRRIERRITILTFTMIFLAIVVIARETRGQEIGSAVTTTAEAVGWALSDLALQQDIDRPHQRFVWIPPWADDKWISAINFAVNTAASHSTTIQLGTPIANGWMLRYDLRRLSPSPKQYDTLRSVWDGLAIQDPYFHLPASVTGISAAVIAPHLAQDQAIALAGLSLSTGAIYRADFLIVKMLSTLEGGKYYDFLQIPKEGRKREDGTTSTPQDDWLATLGVFEKTTQTLSGDQRSALFRSSVTGKPRRIDVFYGLGRGGNLVTITRDVGDEDISAGQHPIRNLLDFQDRAREIIIERPNGTHAFALTDSSGNFQASAPDNVVRDHTVPIPHTSRLQPAISCIRCHGPHDGYQPFGNDVQKLLASNIDVFSDLGVGLTREQAVDRLAGLYAGQLDVPDGPIGRGRRDYLSMMFRIAGNVDPFSDNIFESSSIVSSVSNQVGKIFSSYRYDMVTPEQACVEIGLKVDAGQGQEGLKKVMGTLSQVVIVDPIVGGLYAGIPVNRQEFEQVFVDMSLTAESLRSGKSVKELRSHQDSKQPPLQIDKSKDPNPTKKKS